jgi:Protein of unknown function (DUF2934)
VPEQNAATQRGKKTAGSRGRKAPVKPPAPSQEEIARRAYEIFLSRDGEPGHEAEDWQQAEKELLEARRARGKG